MVDAGNLALTTTYEYNGRGEVIREIDPAGHDRRYERNQMGWITRTISPEVVDGSGVYYETDMYYDGMGNVVRRDVQNRDENGVLQANTHFTTIYEYNLLNELVCECSESGSYSGVIGGTVNEPSCDGLPPSEFITKKYEKKYDYDTKQYIRRVTSGEAVEGRQTDNTVTNVYDERDLVFKVIKAEGSSFQSTTQYDYDGNGNAKKIRAGLESNPRITLKSYDGYDQLVSSTDPMGNKVTYSYDENGNRVSEIIEGELEDEPGSTGNIRLSETIFEYDARDRLRRRKAAHFEPSAIGPAKITGDGWSITDIEYDANGQVSLETDDNGHETRTVYDTAHRRSRVTDARGNTITYGYDKDSNVVRIARAENSGDVFVTTSAYDNVGRRIRSTDNDNNDTTYSYDSRGNLTVVVDARTNKTRNTYDGVNRLTQTVRDMDGDGAYGDGDDITTKQGWDDNSRLISRTDDNNNATVYEYNPLGTRVTEEYADGTRRSAKYDVHGNVVESEDANGSIVTVEYDLNDRLTDMTIVVGAGVSNATTFEKYEYDGRSRLVYAQDNDSVVTFTRDSLSNVTSETLNGQTTVSEYDGVGNQIRNTYPGGRVIACTFDELGRKKLIRDETGAPFEVSEYFYAGSGRVGHRDYGNGTRTSYLYDNLEQISRTTHARIAGGVIIDDRTYQRDAVSSKTQRKDVRAGGRQLTHNYTYDDVNRMVRAKVTTPSAVVVRDTNYNLEGVQNRIDVDGNQYTTNVVNEYTATPFDTRTHDDNGNLKRTSTVFLTDEENMFYDYRNQMVAYSQGPIGSNIVGFAYDALGRRFEKQVGTPPQSEITRYLYNGWQVVEEQDKNNVTGATYVYGNYIDEVLNMQRDRSDYYYHADDLYSVMAVTDASGVAVERCEYGDYGNPEFFDGSGNPIAGSAIGNPYLFTGRRYDPETRLYYYRTRYLEPLAGRFTTRDTIGIWGDMANLGNGYAYIGNNSARGTDPMGLNEGCSVAVYGGRGVQRFIGEGHKEFNCTSAGFVKTYTHETTVGASATGGAKGVSVTLSTSHKEGESEQITLKCCDCVYMEYTFDCTCEQGGFWRGWGWLFTAGTVESGYWKCTKISEGLKNCDIKKHCNPCPSK